MKTYSLIKTKAGERKGNEISYFWGDSHSDKKMLNEVEKYLRIWLEGYNNSLTTEETNELFADFDGSFSYDVWSFNLEENE
jgi:hypothetical protein